MDTVSLNPNSVPVPEEGPLMGFNGCAEEVTLADLVQLACLEGGQRVLKVTREDNEGEIFFAKGEVVHAVSPDAEGENAFFKIMSWPAGSFSLRKAEAPGRTITTPWNFLLIEALRRTDEGQSCGDQPDSEAITALVVDDSRVVCRAMNQLLTEDFGVKTVLRAENGREALGMLEQHRPDIVTLDINMPIMGGDVTLKHIMIRSPAPVVLLSGLDHDNFDKVMEFLRLGAVDFVPKPADPQDWSTVAARLQKHLAHSRTFRVTNIRRARTARPVSGKTVPGRDPERLLIIFGGTGGLLELQKILPALTKGDRLSVLVVQDMAGALVTPLAAYLNRFSTLTVSALPARGLLKSSLCYLTNWESPGDVLPDEEGPVLQALPASSDIPPPAVLLRSAAAVFGPRLCVLLLSGTDLAAEAGLHEVVSRGGRILLQNPDSALHSVPLEHLKSLELEDQRVEPEEAGELVSRWCLGAGEGVTDAEVPE